MTVMMMMMLMKFFAFTSTIYLIALLILPQVFFSVMFGAMQLGQAGPNFADIATAQGAAYQVFLVIDRVH